MRTFGHMRHIRDEAGNIIGQKESPVRVMTREELGGAFGCDKKRRLVLTLAGKDTIKMKPHGTRREVSILAVDVYRYALQCVANKAHMEKMRNRKSAKAIQREKAKLAQQERRFRAGLKAANNPVS